MLCAICCDVRCRSIPGKKQKTLAQCDIFMDCIFPFSVFKIYSFAFFTKSTFLSLVEKHFIFGWYHDAWSEYHIMTDKFQIKNFQIRNYWKTLFWWQHCSCCCWCFHSLHHFDTALINWPFMMKMDVYKYYFVLL